MQFSVAMRLRSSAHIRTHCCYVWQLLDAKKLHEEACKQVRACVRAWVSPQQAASSRSCAAVGAGDSETARRKTVCAVLRE